MSSLPYDGRDGTQSPRPGTGPGFDDHHISRNRKLRSHISHINALGYTITLQLAT